MNIINWPWQQQGFIEIIFYCSPLSWSSESTWLTSSWCDQTWRQDGSVDDYLVFFKPLSFCQWPLSAERSSSVIQSRRHLLSSQKFALYWDIKVASLVALWLLLVVAYTSLLGLLPRCQRSRVYRNQKTFAGRPRHPSHWCMTTYARSAVAFALVILLSSWRPLGSGSHPNASLLVLATRYISYHYWSLSHPTCCRDQLWLFFGFIFQ